MYKQTQIDLAKHRLNTAVKTLEKADLLFKTGNDHDYDHDHGK
jgi:hypothetical protein